MWTGLWQQEFLIAAERFPPTANPPNKAFFHPPISKCFPLPKGNSYTNPLEKLCGISPLDRSLSSLRLKLSATGKFATGPVRMAASNTEDASSISFENV